jgi:hypothetical protein
MKFYWEEIVGIIVGVILALGLIALVLVAVASDAKARARFMEQCIEDRPEYECTAMWRAGEATVVPVPIVIPIR